MLAGGVWNDLVCTASQSMICEDACVEGEDQDGDGYLRCGEDCDDSNAAVNPGTDEVCGNGIDEDCSGWPDDGPVCEAPGAVQ